MTTYLGNLTEHAACCGHIHWWLSHGDDKKQPARKPFALPDTKKRYAPDLDVDVHHVKLDLSVDPVKKSLSGVAYTTFSPRFAALNTVSFDAASMVIESVVDSAGNALDFEHEGDRLHVTLAALLAPDVRETLAVKYKSANPKLGIYFTGPSPFYSDKPYQVWTQSQDDDAHHWHPVLTADHPSHRMTSEVIARVPSTFTALSNGSLVSETDNGDGTRSFHWLHDKSHVSYLMALVVGEFVKLEEMLGELPVQAYVDKSMEDRAREYFKGTAALVKLFGDLYGVPYPWPGKYAQVFVQEFIFGGMENTTITVMTDRILASAGTREEQRLQEVRLNAHELNHHWNGDLVTCREWAHAWLNEGGATYGEVEAVEHLLGEKARDHYVYNLSKVYFAEDRRYRRPIVCQTYREPIDLFDRHLYQKGGLVRHMIRYMLGDKGYYDSIKTYYQDNLYQPVETIDLIKAIEKVTGKNMREFFDQWVFGAGFPEYKVSYRYDLRSHSCVVKVAQTQTIEGETGLFKMPIPISFGMRDGTFKDFTVLVEDKEHTFTFPMQEPPTMFRFDPHNYVLKTVELDVPRLMLANQLKGDPAVMGRIFAAQALAKIADDKAVDALKAAADFDADPFFWAVSSEAATCLGQIKTRYAARALKELASQAEPRVRRAVVNSLGNYKTAQEGKVLAGIVSGGTEKSEFVLADACAALGRTGWSGAFKALSGALAIDSWNEIVRVGALNGLAELGDSRGVDLAHAWARPGKPMAARPSALGCLGKLAAVKTGKGKSKVKTATAANTRALGVLHKLAANKELAQFTLRMALVNALGEAKSESSIAVLEALKGESHDGRVKRLIAETITKIGAKG